MAINYIEFGDIFKESLLVLPSQIIKAVGRTAITIEWGDFLGLSYFAKTSVTCVKDLDLGTASH